MSATEPIVALDAPRGARASDDAMLLARATAGTTLSASTTMYPSSLEVVSGALARDVPTTTTYGYVLDGRAALRASGVSAELPEGGYFAAPGAFTVASDGLVVLVARTGFLGLLQVGVIEARGRLAYIDGCSDTLLVCPPRAGDPAFNHLHFPAGVTQREHLHPTVRLGVVARGAGVARLVDGERALTRGSVFLIDAHERHAFRTTGDAMDVIAFHPDSDWGPTDAAHPMRSRTYLLTQLTRRN